LGQRCANKYQESTALLSIKNKKIAECGRLKFGASSSIGQNKKREHMKTTTGDF
jgi:hypothetical protein